MSMVFILIAPIHDEFVMILVAWVPISLNKRHHHLDLQIACFRLLPLSISLQSQFTVSKVAACSAGQRLICNQHIQNSMSNNFFNRTTLTTFNLHIGNTVFMNNSC